MSDLRTWMLGPPRLTLAVAESMTCGRVQARVGAISGASDFFLGGITAYTLDEKVRHLGVDRGNAERVDSVSADIAGQMARGVCDLFGSDLGVGTTGYAEPSAERGISAPFAWWAVAHRLRNGDFAVRTGRADCPGLARTEAQERVAGEAIAALADLLKNLRR
jgi:nicotinamide-nucleotide amidase